MRLASVTTALAFGLASAASAVIIDSGDGTGNTTAPTPDDPGWSHVGSVNGAASAIYLGGKFMLTANHVGPGNFLLDNQTYTFVPGTAVQLDNGDATYADLLMFEIYPEPSLPALEIASLPPLVTTPVIMIGNGRNRGPATSWSGIDGYEWGPGVARRWGTNTVSSVPSEVLDTIAFPTDFTAPGLTQTAHEAQAAPGDSGGATFALNAGEWELAGVMFVIGAFEGQPPATALYGNETYSADLSFYRDQILEVMAMPEPGGGLWPGVALAALLARRTPVRRAEDGSL